MKIGTLTFHNADNCGAVLQAYALSQYLTSISGYKVDIIDYCCSNIENEYIPSNRIKSKKPGKTILNALFFGSRINKIHNGFKSFRKEHLCVSSKRYTQLNHREIATDYDVVISGSDQVFNLNITGDDTTYFCDFIADEKKSFTYAASIGKYPTEKNDIEKFISLLNNFRVVSFREKSSVDFVGRECPQIKCQTNIDPVFLLKDFEWKTIASNSLGKPYVLYFTVQKPVKLENVLATVKNNAKMNRATPIFLSVNPYKPILGFKNMWCESPAKFIGYIKEAECVFTTSFHATAFAIIMHKNFFVEVNIKKSERILDLLDLVGLSHRAMRDGVISCDYEITEEEWAYADSRIEEERQKAKKYLTSIIKSKEDNK